MPPGVHTVSARVAIERLLLYRSGIDAGGYLAVRLAVKVRLWLNELTIAAEDRARTNDFLDEVVRCLETKPRPDEYGALAAIDGALGYWRARDTGGWH